MTFADTHAHFAAKLEPNNFLLILYMGTWPAHHVACAFIFKVVFTTVCHLPCLNLSRPLHFLPPRVVCCITMETLAHLLLLPLHLWQKTSRDKDWQLTSEHNRFIDFLSCFDNRRTCISDKPLNKHLICSVSFRHLSSKTVCVAFISVHGGLSQHLPHFSMHAHQTGLPLLAVKSYRHQSDVASLSSQAFPAVSRSWS